MIWKGGNCIIYSLGILSQTYNQVIAVTILYVRYDCNIVYCVLFKLDIAHSLSGFSFQ